MPLRKGIPTLALGVGKGAPGTSDLDISTYSGKLVLTRQASSTTAVSLSSTGAALRSVDASFHKDGLSKLVITNNTRALTMQVRDFVTTGWDIDGTLTVTNSKLASIDFDADCFLGADSALLSACVDLSNNALTTYGNLFVRLAAVSGKTLSLDLQGGTNRSLTVAEWALWLTAWNNNTWLEMVGPPATLTVASAADYPAAAGLYTYNAADGYWYPPSGTWVMGIVDGVWGLSDGGDTLLKASAISGATWYLGETAKDVVTTLT